MKKPLMFALAVTAVLLSFGTAELLPEADAATAAVTFWQIPTANSVPGGIVVDTMSGDIYFAETGGNKIGRLNSRGDTITEWSVGGNPVFLTTDISLGNFRLYFTEGGGNTISTLAPSINGYSYESVPTPSSWPKGIALTLIGMTLVPSDIWFTERLGNNLGRLAFSGFTFDVVLPVIPSRTLVTPTTKNVKTTTRVAHPVVTLTWGSPPLPPAVVMSPGATTGPFTEWDLSSIQGHPGPISVGPSGDLWISTEVASIVQCVPGSNLFYFHDLPKGSASYDLEVDAASSVWFTEGYKDMIGQLDPTTGVVSEWALSAGSQPLNLAIDRNSGIVWFTEREGNRIGSLDPATNTLVEYQLSADTHPVDIAIDETTGTTTILFTAERGNFIGAIPLAILGIPQTLFDTITLSDIKKTVLSADRINGSDSPSNRIPAGTILLYQTSDRRYGKLEVVSYGSNLTLKWVTYNADGTVYSNGNNLLIRATWECDLDLGIEGGTLADFWWEHVTSTARYVQPINGAIFSVFKP